MGLVSPDGSSQCEWVQSIRMGSVSSDGSSQSGWVQSVRMGPVSLAWTGSDSPVCVVSPDKSSPDRSRHNVEQSTSHLDG